MVDYWTFTQSSKHSFQVCKEYVRKPTFFKMVSRGQPILLYNRKPVTIRQWVSGFTVISNFFLPSRTSKHQDGKKKEKQKRDRTVATSNHNAYAQN